MRIIASLFLFSATVALTPSVMAQTVWEISTPDTTSNQINGVELIIAQTGSGITGPIAVNPSAAVFSAPPPGNELNLSWATGLLTQGQTFEAEFTLADGLTPFLGSGNWTFNGTPVQSVNPALAGFGQISTPEPSTITLASLAAAGLAVTAIRRRRNGKPRAERG